MRARHLVVLVLVAAGCDSQVVTPPADDPTPPTMRTDFFDFPPQDGSDTENPKSYSTFPTRIKATPTSEVTVNSRVTDPESGLIWVDLYTLWLPRCVLPDGSPGKVLDDREGVYSNHERSGDPYAGDPKPPFPAERFVSLKMPLIHRGGPCPPEQRTLMFPVSLNLVARAGNGVQVGQATEIVPDRPGRW
jgi:hypothetical protein